jgi:adsorption protein B
MIAMLLNSFLILLGLIFFIGSLDDLIIDILRVILRKSIWRPSRSEWMRIQNQSEKAIAVMIPAWKEHSVLRAMVETNLKRIHYSNYKWYIGVYPNDQATLSVARQLELEFPQHVKVVVTDRPGPTSKAHCLNCIIRQIEEESAGSSSSSELRWVPIFAVIHDAEDVVDPDSFKLVNSLPEGEYDFVQIPVLSMPVAAKKWVAGTYMDEFADVHLRELPVRQFLKMPIPSAGVGTYFQWDALKELSDRMGYCFDEGNLTEDYEISLRMSRLGFRQKFLLVQTPEGRLVATREFFPDALGHSIRQKTRWTTGIALQTRDKWGTYGSSGSLWSDLMMRYALWRDRKSLWSNPLTLAGLVFLLGIVGLRTFDSSNVGILSFMTQSQTLGILLQINLVFFIARLIQRAHYCRLAYGWISGLLAVPRYFVSTWINGIVSLRALRQYYATKTPVLGPRRMEWDKTEHKYPTLEEIRVVEAMGRSRLPVAQRAPETSTAISESENVLADLKD